MYQKRFGIVLSIAAVVFCGFRYLHSTGIVGVTQKPNHQYVVPGCFCHDFSPTPSVHVILEGPDSLTVGQLATYRIHVIKDSNIAAGFNVATVRGALTTGDSTDQQLMDWDGALELTHTEAKLANGNDTITWVFHYEAPETATIDTVYAAGNSVNLSLDPDGDYWNFAVNKIVRVYSTTGIANDGSPIPSFALQPNYPNPFNPLTVIHYQLPVTDYVTLKLYNVVGQLVATLVNEVKQPGNYEVTWDASGQPSGIYIYRLTAGNRAESRKMVLLK